MNADDVARRLGLGEYAREWLAHAAGLQVPAGGLRLPPAGGARAALAPLGLARADEDELVGLWPGGSWPAELVWVVERMYARLVADLAAGAAEGPAWPVLVYSADARVRCAVLVALAAAVPRVLEAHARWGVPAEVSAATLADTGRHVSQTRTMFGCLGLETTAWMALHFRGGVFELGRLHFEPDRVRAEDAVSWYGSEGAAAMGVEQPAAVSGCSVPVLRLHIPVEGPLDPVRVEDSLARARGFFNGCFGVDYPVASCSSWLLDPQLAEYLPRSSNILAFQRRFALLEEGEPGDADVFRFVFWLPEVDVDRAPRRTRLEKAVADHLRAGRHWRVRTGWLRLA